MSAALKPCPFCGGEAHTMPPSIVGVTVRCSNCSARTIGFHAATAQARWNARAGADRDDLIAQRDALKADVERLTTERAELIAALEPFAGTYSRRYAGLRAAFAKAKEVQP